MPPILKKIPLSKIALQQSISNRDIEEMKTSKDFIQLIGSIRELGLIHPIVVKKEVGEHYTLYVGERRYFAFSQLLLMGERTFNTIDAFVYPSTEPTKNILNLTIHENDARNDLHLREGVEAKISLLPFYFGIGKENKKRENFTKGYQILALFNSYERSIKGSSHSSTNGAKWIEKLKEETGSDNPIFHLREYFNGLGEGIPTFYRKARVFFTCENRIIILYRKNKVSVKEALKLQKMSDEVRATILTAIEAGGNAKDEIVRYEKNIKKDTKKEDRHNEAISLAEGFSALLTSGNKKESLKMLKKIEKLIKEL